ncbi:energy-coupling factor transport system ATP-binding protein [Granulicatella balaenopterae]|uniref:Energy-coupling factor transport system ATP-binding protein n=1 Tax=Granulicatella balaenopterae TaxID=137733 RepID=A0A1H9J7J7_9LACT|nr:energy-coupling factor ABC transporter ATP-binding protein [Granulicatella balaenopterae]SEQ82747.1 energy-coupling factor transport system ATP-binding protein [Granulicatella balaenopterae]
MEKAIIELQNINYTYHNSEKKALSDISFKIFPGEWVAIIGHNGSGKSTVAKIMNGLLEANSGTVFINGVKMTYENVYDCRKNVGMVFQNPDNQFVGNTVEDDIAFGLENNGIPREEMLIRIEDALKRVKMTGFETREPARLSGGQKQRVAIAGIIALSPKVIILDESTSMLDPEGRLEVIQTIEELHQTKNMTVISITHDINEASRADKIIMMNQGQVDQIGTPDEIFKIGLELVEKGLDVPFSEKLKYELAQKGINVPTEYMDEERLVDWIWKYLLNT